MKQCWILPKCSFRRFGIISPGEETKFSSWWKRFTKFPAENGRCPLLSRAWMQQVGDVVLKTPILMDRCFPSSLSSDSSRGSDKWNFSLSFLAGTKTANPAANQGPRARSGCNWAGWSNAWIPILHTFPSTFGTIPSNINLSSAFCMPLTWLPLQTLLTIVGLLNSLLLSSKCCQLFISLYVCRLQIHWSNIMQPALHWWGQSSYLEV